MRGFQSILGVDVHVFYLEDHGELVAFAWHRTEDRAMEHMKRIMEYHNLDGRILRGKYDGWLMEKLEATVIKGLRFELPQENYTSIEIYEAVLDIPHGAVETYSSIAHRARVRYTEVLRALMRNPFQVLIPCHRLITKKGTLMGFHPLGMEVKRRLLVMEGAVDG